MISAVNGRKRALLTKSALEWHNKRCTAQSTLCVGNKKGKTELKAMCDFKKKKKKFFFFFFSIAILGSRYDTRIAGPSIAMHRCIDASLRPYYTRKPATSANRDTGNTATWFSWKGDEQPYRYVCMQRTNVVWDRMGSRASGSTWKLQYDRDV